MAKNYTKIYRSQASEAEKNRPTYESQYQSNIDALMDRISNRKEFSYDFNADPLYQQYKDQYTTLGNQAATNAAASVSTLTGGYGNSYAATAATQANQQYLNQLNNVIPELYSAAMDKYNKETENLYNQFDMYNTAESNAYGKYRDTVSDWMGDRDYYYGKYRDSVGDDQWRKEFNLTKDQWEWQKKQAKKAKSGSGGGRRRSTSAGTDTTQTEAPAETNNTPTYDKETNKASAAAYNNYLATARQRSSTTGDAAKWIEQLWKDRRISEYQKYTLLNSI